MNRARVGIVVLALAAAALPGAARAAAPSGPFVPGQALVKFRSSASDAARARALDIAGARVVRAIPRIGWSLLSVPDAVRAVEALRASPAVAAAETNGTGTAFIDPNDTCLQGCGNARQWNVDAVNARAGWSVVPGRFYTSAEKATMAAPRIRVAVLDTKIDVMHPDWRNANPLPVPMPQDARSGGQLALEFARDIVTLNRQQGPADYHGTFVAGILAAATNNGTGVAGLGYRSEIVPVTVVDGNGVATAADVADGIVYARDVGARVINLSLGLTQTSAAVQDAIFVATQAGALVVAAAGNSANDQPFYPASHADVMAVSGVDEADRRAPCSNFGRHISVAAPATGILSMDPRTQTGLWVAGCGTSTAAPHVSALASLLFAQNPNRTPAQVRAIIERSADDDRFRSGPDPYFGEGRINFERALRDGVGPVVDRVVASVPRALGGSSSFTAVARANASRPIREAEWFIDSLGAPGTGGEVTADDGAFGENGEDLRSTIQVPLVFPTGVHRLFIRARDDSGWGAASVGVLIADRGAPRVTNFAVTQAAVSAAGIPVRITFDAADDYATVLSYSFTATSTVTGQVAYASEPVSFEPGSMTVEWPAPPGLIGPHQIELTVRDEADNPARVRAGTILV